MSTKSTIAYRSHDIPQSYHLYEECGDTGHVYLQVDGIKAEVIHSTTRQSVTVAIPVEMWREIVKGWCDSYWGQHPELDGHKPTLDIEGLEELVKRFKKHEEK